MNVEKLVPFEEVRKRKDANYPTLREVLATMEGASLAGQKELELIISSPGTVVQILSEDTTGFHPAILFCGSIHTHENGNEYVDALCLKKGTLLATEKCWLQDLVLPSFSIALKD
ncbi:MAG: hypothetical protein RL538_136 [Candidatus Parcubacteria bacterium]|jgi:hypothetical protein